MSRTTRAFRRNAAAHHASAVEFAELLDAIVIATVLVADQVVPFATERAANRPAPFAPPTEVAPEHVHEMAEEPMRVSRFADAGLDDDRLPIRSTARRKRRR